MRYAAHNVRKGTWTKPTMEAYLTSCCVPDKVSKDVWKYCSEKIPEFMENDDERYIPYIWLSTMPMSAFIETVMHLLFHGIVASIMNVMDRFMSDHGTKTAFEARVNPHIAEIVHLRLEWLKLKPVPKKMVGRTRIWHG